MFGAVGQAAASAAAVPQVGRIAQAVAGLRMTSTRRRRERSAVEEPPPVDLDEVQIWDLLQAFNTLMKEVGVRKPKYHEVTYDDTPIDLHAADIEDRLTREGRLTLSQLIVGRKSRSEMVGVFLALLELIRQKKILVTQNEVLDDIEIEPAPEEHRKLYAQASLHLADEAPPPPADATPTDESHPEFPDTN